MGIQLGTTAISNDGKVCTMSRIRRLDIARRPVLLLFLFMSGAICEARTPQNVEQNTTSGLRYAAFAEATAERLTDRQYAYLLLQSGAAERGFRYNVSAGQITSPEDARAFLRNIPPVSVSIGGGGVPLGFGIDARSAVEFAWELLFSKDAADLQSRISLYRSQNPLTELSIASSVLAAYDSGSSLDATGRAAIKNAWQSVISNNNSLPPPNATLRDLVNKYGASAVKELVENYKGRILSDSDLNKYLTGIANGTEEIDPKALSQSAKAVQAKRQTELANEQITLLRQVAARQAAQEAEQVKADEMRQFDTKIRDLKGAVYITSTLFRITGDAETSRIVSTAGQGAIDVATGIHSLLNDPAKLAASANIVGGALLLFSAFGNSQGDPFQNAVLKQQQEILDQLFQVRQQLGAIQFQVAQLQSLGADILEHQSTHFAYVEDQLRALRGDVGSIRGDIEALNLATIVREYNQDYESAARLLNSPRYLSSLRSGHTDGQLITLTGKQVSLATTIAEALALTHESSLSSRSLDVEPSREPFTKWLPAIAMWSGSDALLDRARTKYWVESRGDASGSSIAPTRNDIEQYLSVNAMGDPKSVPEPSLWFIGTANYIELVRLAPEKLVDTNDDIARLCRSGARILAATDFLARVAPTAYAAWRNAAAEARGELQKFEEVSYTAALGFKPPRIPINERVRKDPARLAAYLGLTEWPTTASGWDTGERAAKYGITSPPFTAKLEAFNANFYDSDTGTDHCAPARRCKVYTYKISGCVYRYMDINWSIAGLAKINNPNPKPIDYSAQRLCFAGSEADRRDVYIYHLGGYDPEQKLKEKLVVELGAKNWNLTEHFDLPSDILSRTANDAIREVDQAVATDFRNVTSMDPASLALLGAKGSSWPVPELRVSLMDLSLANWTSRYAALVGIGSCPYPISYPIRGEINDGNTSLATPMFDAADLAETGLPKALERLRAVELERADRYRWRAWLTGPRQCTVGNVILRAGLQRIAAYYILTSRKPPDDCAPLLQRLGPMPLPSANPSSERAKRAGRARRPST